MHPIDLSIFIVYIVAMLGIGIWFHIRNKDLDDFYVGGRQMGSWHIGFSVVATDVGGGFSIGLGGLGFAIGLSGSWMLFTGLLGAWLSAVFLIPKIKPLSDRKNLYTFPQIFESYYGRSVAVVAGVISAILSTADSCLIAASGNILTDIIEKVVPGGLSKKRVLLFSKILTLVIGIIAVGIALKMTEVLQLMLYSYAIMVSGLLIPVLALLIFKRPDTMAALSAMIAGGTITILLTAIEHKLPYGLAANIFGISAAAMTYITIHFINHKKHLPS